MNASAGEPAASARAVFVTGCSSGIGEAAARALSERGYRVFASARRAGDLARLRGLGCTPVALELADSASVRRAAGEVLEATAGDLYALFNNAAFGQPGALEDLPRAVLRAQFEVNLFGTHELTRALLPAMRGRGRGRIVLNSSVLGLVAMRFRGAYTASKFALEGWGDSLRMELAGSGVHVSIIEPGPIRSRFRENALAAFASHVDAAASVHHDAYRAVLARLESSEEATFTLGPDAVLEALFHALESRRPRLRYPVTVPTRALGLLRRLLPGRWLDALLRGASRAELQAPQSSPPARR